MVVPIDPTSVAFLLAESRRTPMHVGGLQLFRPPEGAGPEFARELYESMLNVDEVGPLFLKHPIRSLALAGQYAWTEDRQFDIEHHVRHSALPQPGRVLELLALCSRLHGTRLARERPLWEAHIIEGLADGRIAMYTKIHHSLVDGISAMRMLQSVLSTDPDERDMPPPWAARETPRRRTTGAGESGGLLQVPLTALRQAVAISADAAGLPGALVRTLNHSVRNETSAVSLHAPRTLINTSITGARRFAAQDWPLERLSAIGKATGATVNDVVLAMCAGAMRSYLLEHGGLPDAPLVAMVPVGLNARSSQSASMSGGNAVGSVMVQLATHLPDAGDRLSAISRSMQTGKEGLASMTPLQITAMSALGMAPAALWPLLRLHGLARPPFNLIISNVPGPRTTHYFNGAQLVGMYPLSIPIHGMGLNITCATYDGTIGFGLTGCRRTVPRLQRLLTHLDDELAALEKAAGVG
ncbi:MAG: wax ester/triacylglycerol synthase family O-acyltransferase [Nocardioides sp.]|nr:wax ester/triacylglycerol synthase family O-acyltransferase [Nocardioides sp.]